MAAAGLAAQIPAALSATALFTLGGYQLAGCVSVGSCLATAVVAARLPEGERQRGPADDAGDLSYWETLRVGITQVAVGRGLRLVLIAVALWAGIDALDEYFPALAQSWGVPTGLIPLAVLGIPMAGAVGAALGGRATQLGSKTLASMVLLGAALLAGAAALRQPAGLAAVAGFYGLYQLVLVVADVRLQNTVDGTARATVTSIAALVTEVAVLGLYAAWALGGLAMMAGIVATFAIALPRLVGQRPPRQEVP